MRAAVGLVLTTLAAACAEMGAPPGGPVDRTPPVLLDSRPDSLATGVPRDAPLHFLFSEELDRGSTKRSLRLIPEVPLEKPRVKDRVLTYRPVEGWPADSVVVWTLSVQLKDKHGVALAEPRQGAFTTAAALPRGVVVGVAGRPESGSEEPPDFTTVRADLNRTPPEGSRRAELWRWSAATGTGRFRLDLLGTPSGPFDLEVYDDRNANGRRDEREPVARLDSLYLAVTDTILDVGRLELVDLEGPVSLEVCLADTGPDSIAALISYWSASSEPEARAAVVDSVGCASASLTPGRLEIAAWLDLDRDGAFGPDSTGASEPFAEPLTWDLVPATPDTVRFDGPWTTLPWAVVDTLKTPPIPRDLFSRGAQ